MPPPHLSRHLRPCHLTVTAKQVRCVHTTGRAKLSTTGYDTTPQTPSAEGSNGESSALSDHTDPKNDAPAEEKSWWKDTLGRIASFGGHGNQFESIESKSGRSPPHAKQPESPAINLPETREESWREERGLTQTTAGLATSQQVRETQQEQMRFADRSNEDFASSGQVDMTAIQQQIKQLSEQLRALEARIEGGSPKEQSSSTSATAIRTLAMRSDATQFNMANQDISYLPQTPSHILQSPTTFSVKGLRIWQKAQSAYTRSVSLYGTATSAFAKLPHHIAAPVAPSLLRRFRSIRGIAMLEDDIKTSDVYVKFKPTVDLLESILRRSSVPAPSLNDPMVASEMARFSKTLFYDDFISHTLDACWKRYRLSTRRLSDIVTELDSIRSPMVAPIASRAREQLQTIIAHAYEEGDRLLIDLLEPYFKTESALQKGERPARTEPSVFILRSADTREKDMQNNITNNRDDAQRLMRRIHGQSWSIKSSVDLKTNSMGRGLEKLVHEQRPRVKDSTSFHRLSNAEASTAARTTTKSSKPPPRTDEVSEQSLLEELFPETNSIPQPQPTKKNRDQYPRLKLPQSPTRPAFLDRPRTPAQQAAKSIQQHGEQTTVLQLTNCSTGLIEADFRRIIPKGKHLEGWRRDSDFYKIIPGRDPLSLERLPFYYLLFKNTEAALSYQKNASRLHKLSARYQPSSILSAIPPPKGFLEDGEDIAAAVASYNLLPKNHTLSLNVLMQPYNPALRQLIERGGYQPIATSVEDKGKKICRVLLHIEGYEPSPSDLFAAITSDAYRQGMLHPLRNESQSSIHRLRDVINLKMSSKAVSSSRPRAYGTFDHSTSAPELTYDDPEIQSMMGGAEEDRSQAQMNQEIMNRVYNRWVLDFEDVDTARRWSLRWHRRALPDVASGESTWKDVEEARICNTEVLW